MSSWRENEIRTILLVSDKVTKRKETQLFMSKLLSFSISENTAYIDNLLLCTWKVKLNTMLGPDSPDIAQSAK